MKVLVSSDWHLDAMTAGVARHAELEPYLAAHLTVDQARTLRDHITAWLEKNSATEQEGQADV